VAAYVGLGGLGRLLIDGLSVNEYDRVFAGAVLVALLAIALDLSGAAVQHAVVSPGLRGPLERRTRVSSRSQTQQTRTAGIPS
jgi:osmoprotectant transport system permease protein